MNDQSVPLRVECYAGHRGEETPRRFVLGDRTVEVAEVRDRWLSPGHRYFKVTGDDGDSYILRHDVASGEWELTLFARGSGPDRGGSGRPEGGKKCHSRSDAKW